MSVWLCYRDETEENDWEWFLLWIEAPDEGRAREVYDVEMGEHADWCSASDEAYLVSARWDGGGMVAREPQG